MIRRALPWTRSTSTIIRMRRRLQTIPTVRMLLRGVLPLLALAALLPSAASAQAPAIGGYAGTAPAVVSGTNPPAAGVAGITVSSPAAPAPTPTPTSGVAGIKQSSPAAPAPVAVPAKGTLPFTGLQIAFMVAAGLGLLGLGLALRRVSGPALRGA